ncbi:MAG TPA: hypothetical protein VMU26_22215 [Candidatus Polarisedimenticolia bacterium]|nr:hypothetical protein [Candidatus Polarisedimenticolia bacterium]
METQVLKQMIDVIRVEEQRRAKRRADMHPDVTYDQWLFTDAPFVNELCLMLLVALRHQVERELVLLAARLAADGSEISVEQYHKNVHRERELLKERDGWKRIFIRLDVKSCQETKVLEALRLLSNSYKHDPFVKPDVKLLKLLNLPSEWPKKKTAMSMSDATSIGSQSPKMPKKKSYAPLPESSSLQEAFAVFVGLGRDADYCDITERFVESVNEFLESLKNRTKVRPFERRLVSLSPQDFEY